MNYFRLLYHLGLKPEEVDRMDGTTVDVFMVALQEINKEGGGGKKERDEVQKAFMG